MALRYNARPGKRGLRAKLSLLLLMLISLAAPLSMQYGTARAQQDIVLIKGFPSVVQWYSLSCEYASAAAVTLYWGNLVSQSDFIREVPTHPNPHKGFRGNIHGAHGGTDDYGIYARPLVPVLERRGYQARAVFADADWLKTEINEGHPIVVWITAGRDAVRNGFYEYHEGERFKLVPYEHAVVVYGYDGDGVYSMDVGSGGFFHTPWDSFLRRWGYFDNMALWIHP